MDAPRRTGKSYFAVVSFAACLGFAASTTQAQDKWTSYGSAEGEISAGDPEATGALRFFLPLDQEMARIIYFNPNISTAPGDVPDLSGVFGARWRVGDSILGVNGFVGLHEGRESGEVLTYGGFGAEFMTERLDLKGNIVIPFGDQGSFTSIPDDLPDVRDPGVPFVDLGNDFVLIDEGNGFDELRFLQEGSLFVDPSLEKLMNAVTLEAGYRFFIDADTERGYDFLRPFVSASYGFSGDTERHRVSAGLELHSQRQIADGRPFEITAGLRYDFIGGDDEAFFDDDAEDGPAAYLQFKLPFGRSNPETTLAFDRVDERMDDLPLLGRTYTKVKQGDVTATEAEFVELIDPFDGNVVERYYEAGGTGVTTGNHDDPTVLADAVAKAGENGFIVLREDTEANGVQLAAGQNIVGGGSAYTLQRADNNVAVVFNTPAATGGTEIFNPNTVSASTAPPAITLDLANDNYIGNVTFRGGNVAVDVTAANHVLIENTSFNDISLAGRSNSDDSAIRITGSQDVTLRNIDIGVDEAAMNFAYGVLVRDSSTILMEDIEISNLQSFDGINLANVEDVDILNVNISNLRGGDANGIQIGTNNATDFARNVTINGGTISDIQGGLSDGIDIAIPELTPSDVSVAISNLTISGITGTSSTASNAVFGIRIGSAATNSALPKSVITINNMTFDMANPNDTFETVGVNNAVGFGFSGQGKALDVTGAGNIVTNGDPAPCRYSAGTAVAANTINVDFTAVNGGGAKTCTNAGVVP